MGCLVSTPRDAGGIRRRPGSVGELAVFVPGLRILRSVDFTQPLGNCLSKSLVDRLTSMRTRIVVMAAQEAPLAMKPRRKTATQHGGSTLADLLQALEDYLPFLLGLVKEGSELTNKVQFVWVNQEDDAEETTIANAWYEVLSALHLMAMLCLSEANSLLLPKTSSEVHQSKVLEESRHAAIDALLKAAGYLDCAIHHVLPQIPPEIRELLPLDLAEANLRALCMQALGQAAAYYYHGMILDEGNTEKSHGMAVAALQAAEEFLKESKKSCEAFNLMPPTSRNPPLWGSMKYLSEKIPKDASSKVRINRDLYNHERIMEKAPTLPDFAVALKPDEYQLPALDPSWNEEESQLCRAQRPESRS